MFYNDLWSFPPVCVVKERCEVAAHWGISLMKFGLVSDSTNATWFGYKWIGARPHWVSVDWLYDSCNLKKKVWSVFVCVGVSCSWLWLHYLWYILVVEPSYRRHFCTVTVDHCWAVIGSLGRVCSQWFASSVYRLVAGRCFPVEDPERTVVGCIWLSYGLQNKLDES